MKTQRLLIASFSLIALGLTSARASGPGSTTGELLKIPVSARAIGMGEAYVGLADDSSALYWNPAGLSFARQKEATFMHSSLLDGIHYEHAAFMAPGDNYSLGASMSYLGYGDIAGYDNTGASIGDLKAYSMILTGGISTILHDRLSLGFAGSFLRQNLANDTAGTVAGNFGGQYALRKHILRGNAKLGLSVLNVGPGLKFISERDPLPRKVKMGASLTNVEAWPLNLTADLTIPNDNDTYVGLGSEYWFKDLVALRLGYAGSNDEGRGLRMGFGMKLREFLFDYAYGGFGDFGATHRINVTWRFGEKLRQLNKDDRKVLQEAKAAENNGDLVQAIMTYEELLEKNPNDDRILKKMIGVHEAMLKNELREAVAQGNNKDEIPSPEEVALQDIVPGQEKLVQNSPMDPLGLQNLPDVTNLDSPSTNPLADGPAFSATPSGAAPAPDQAIPPTVGSGAGGPVEGTPSPSSAQPDPSASPTNDANSGDSPLLNPADFK